MNAATVKTAFPQEFHPKLYRKQKRKTHVTTEMPFDTKQVRQLITA